MLSYLHGYHAGNHADVLKHLCLIGLLQALAQKPKALCYFETHAGSARYNISGQTAERTGEFERGAKRLLTKPASDPLLATYQQLIQAQNADAAVQHYPGSPCIAQSLLRPHDHIQLCELHPAEFGKLRRHMAGDERVHVHKRDGFTAIKALLPPVQSRGLLLLDPAYEQKQDYDLCISAIKTARHRFRAASIALWYPRLPRDPAAGLLKALRQLKGCEYLHLILDVDEAIGDFGMFGSGMLILQPPWKLQRQLQSALAEAVPQLAPQAKFQIESGAGS